ncbi:MAG: Coenzyme F420 hydrogenase/dehydrogenase, beta subunit C-terminal domain [Chloroflexi bacterium]|nr:Coenzyme F420 hydrogenase/dehydrogenase, beta subunit C-terminal domain [Chloroflexota bacterium]
MFALSKPTLSFPPLHFERLRADVISAGICVRCGVCTGACPVSCIRMDAANPEPHLVAGTECTSCGLCVAACPERGVDYAELSAWQFGKTLDRWDLGGVALKGFIGHIADEAIWQTTSGGGLVTGLLIHLLSSGQFDGALVAGFDEEQPWRAKPKLVRTREEILKTTRSKHSLVSIADTLRELRGRAGRYILVGAGCHVSGLRKLQQAEPAWQDKIPLVIGIACGGNWYPEGTDYLLRGMGITDPAQIVEFAYRAADGTGANARLQNGERKSTSKRFGHDVYRMNLLYHAEGCSACPDLLSVLADITVGDTGPGKQSFAFLRSAQGIQAMEGAVRAGVIVGEWHASVDPRRGLRKDHPLRVRIKYREAYSVIARRQADGLAAPCYGSFSLDARALWTRRRNRWIWEIIYFLVHSLWIRRLLSVLPSDLTYVLGKLRGTWELSDSGFWGGMRHSPGQRPRGDKAGSPAHTESRRPSSERA